MNCGASVSKELGRCGACDSGHQALCKQLDAKPVSKVEKVPVEWVSYKQVRGGVMVTTYMTKQEAILMGKRIE